MTITAKFQSRCPCCDRVINPGETIRWNKGEKARHIICDETSPKAPKPRSQPSTTAKATQKQVGYANRLLDMGRTHSDGWNPTYEQLQQMTRKEISDFIDDIR